MPVGHPSALPSGTGRDGGGQGKGKSGVVHMWEGFKARRQDEATQECMSAGSAQHADIWEQRGGGVFWTTTPSWKCLRPCSRSVTQRLISTVLGAHGGVVLGKALHSGFQESKSEMMGGKE